MVWRKTAGRWGWVDVDLGGMLGQLVERTRTVRGWIEKLENRMSVLADDLADVKCRVGKLEEKNG